MDKPHGPPGAKLTRLSQAWYRLVTFGFRLLYYELAWTYDAVAWSVSRGQWKAWGQTAIPYLVGHCVLELGFGPGHLLVALAERDFHLAGLDTSPHMARMARRRLRRSGLRATLARAHAQNIPFPDHAFDSVVATFPTAHIIEPETIAEITRVLRPGGRLVVVVGARLTGRDTLRRFVEWLYFATGQREAMDSDAWETDYATAGLAMRQVQVDMNGSQVWLLIADRLNHDG
jgi:ubiquinone/menaquinone biosynthesis C-methylase UbiE